MIKKKKILVVSPHFSTGGAPQVTVSKVKMLAEDFDVEVVEHSMLAWQFVVQRNRIIEIVGEKKFHTLHGTQSEKGKQLFEIIDWFRPDYLSMEEFPEMFMDMEWAKKIYDYEVFGERPYYITETTHDSSFPVDQKKVFPDLFVFISAFSAMKYAKFNTASVVIEYPVDNKSREKISAQKKLGLSKDEKHIVIVGLFTPRKNQKYAFELAEKLKGYKVKFHFLGNQAENFQNYWKPLMDNKPDNCIVWGEKSNVDDFIQASDLFLFTSKGEKNNKELNPIVIKESAEYQDLPKLIFNLDVYMNKYNDRFDFHFLTGDLENDAEQIKSIIKPVAMDIQNRDEIIIIGTYPNLKKREELTKDCINSLKPLNRKIMLVSHYPVSAEIQRMVDYYVYDRENPLTYHSYYTRFFNYMPGYDVEININGLKDTNQSFTVLTNLSNAFEAAKSMGFKAAFYITYDVVVNELDYEIIEETFNSIQYGDKCYLSTIKTPMGYGIQTTAMTFDVQAFINTFGNVKTVDEYNLKCESIGAHNFLEDYMMKVIDIHRNNGNHRYRVLNTDADTFLKHSGLGVSSNSEYYSILPIRDSSDEYMFYFYTYNIDERIIHVTLNSQHTSTTYIIDISKNREYKIPISYRNAEMTITMDFYDGDNLYKTERYVMNDSNIEKYSRTGFFKWKRRPKIKLVHLQTTLNLEKEQQSREQLQTVSQYGWNYVLHQNEPYKGLPPANTCMRPDCVSMELFDEETVQRIGTALTPAHYGCYESFKIGILSEFDEDCDFLMVCEGDCKIETSVSDFIARVEATCQTISESNIGIMSYGDKATLEHGWPQSPVVAEVSNDAMYITNHIIGLQSIMFPRKARKWLFEKLRTSKWDGADMYFNSIFRDSEWEMGIVKSRLTSQFDGYSLIDKQEKKFI